MQGISALVHEFGRSRSREFEIIFPVMLVTIDFMILAVGSLEQAESRFQCQCRPFGNGIDRSGFRQVRNGEVNVFQHLAHDELTGVARLVEPVIL